MTELIGWLLGLDQVTSIKQVRPALSAEWATRGSGPFWLFFACVAICVLVAIFYFRFQTRGSMWARGLLALMRAGVLILLLVTLAEPVLRASLERIELPSLFLVIDGSASMQIRDRYSADQQARLEVASGLQTTESSPPPQRIEWVQGWLERDGQKLFDQLQSAQPFELRAFLFDGRTTSQLRELKADNENAVDPELGAIADRVTADGQVTAIGNVLRDILRQSGIRNLASVVFVSDFAQNSGESPLGATTASVSSPAVELARPVFTIGVGAGQARDLAITLQTDPKMRRGEKTSVRVELRQVQLEGQTATVRLMARSLESADTTDETLVGEKTLQLSDSLTVIELPFTPDLAGQFELSISAEPLPGEIVVDNNKVSRRIQVIDDFVRLLYVADEPTWEWRFVKEVFHRDQTVGMRGFRTYLASSDPRVRESNPLFLSTLIPGRSEFFANDVIFLDDVSSAILTPRFCDLVERFVRDLGGGLVVMAGPRFGSEPLHDSPLARMLPVILDPQAPIRDAQAFSLQRTSRAREFMFMQLGDSPEDNERAWANLKETPWYQPVAQSHERAVVLAEHPTDKCHDGKTPQPIIAIRRFGEGEVVYLGFNEMWRLRRLYGETYYRRFWSPLIDRLGLSHALGPRKRFVPRLDRESYRIDEDVILTVQAYDGEYEPLKASAVDGGALVAEVVAFGQTGLSEERALSVPALRDGIFEIKFPVFAAGTYRVRVKDPLSGTSHERQFQVTDASAEMRQAVRDEQLQFALASQTGGRSFTLDDAHKLADHLRLEPRREIDLRSFPLWQSPVWFTLIVALLLTEWAVRKWVHLT